MPDCRYTRCSARIATGCRCIRCAAGITRTTTTSRAIPAAHRIHRQPVYSMCGWNYENDNDLSRYRRAISTAIEQGYRAVKIKVGRASVDDDVKRIRVALDMMGKERRVMVDSNQVFNRNEAL